MKLVSDSKHDRAWIAHYRWMIQDIDLVSSETQTEPVLPLSDVTHEMLKTHANTTAKMSASELMFIIMLISNDLLDRSASGSSKRINEPSGLFSSVSRGDAFPVVKQLFDRSQARQIMDAIGRSVYSWPMSLLVMGTENAEKSKHKVRC